MNYQPLKYIYKASGNPEAYTMLLLHGTGGNENDLLDLGESFGADLSKFRSAPKPSPKSSKSFSLPPVPCSKSMV